MGGFCLYNGLLHSGTADDQNSPNALMVGEIMEINVFFQQG
jgi:hypothetical protein